MQAHPFECERSHHRNVLGHQLRSESVFFTNLRFAPSVGSVKLSHHRAVVIQMNLVDTVFVRAQSAQAPVNRQVQTT